MRHHLTKMPTGLGLAMAKALAHNGATVYALSRRGATLESASTSLDDCTPGTTIFLECDVTSKPSLAAAAQTIAARSGHVNLVVANAGIMGPNDNALLPRPDNDPKGPLTIQEAQAHLWQTPTDHMLDVYRTNVAGSLYTAVAFLSLLHEGNVCANVKQSSQILVMSSIGGFYRSWSQAGLAYTTSKAAVTHLVKSLASFLSRWRIRVNGLAPGRECGLRAFFFSPLAFSPFVSAGFADCGLGQCFRRR